MSLFSSRNKLTISEKKEEKTSSELNMVLVHSVFEDMEEISFAVCIEGTENIFLYHSTTVSTHRLGPLPVTAKLYQ